MKKTLFTLALVFLFSLAGHAVDLVGYWTGAWYETAISKSARPRQAGQIDVYQYSDGTLEVDIWRDAEIVNTGTGVWVNKPGNKFAVTFNTGAFSYKGGGTGYFWSGTFKAVFPGTTVLGKWQMD